MISFGPGPSPLSPPASALGHSSTLLLTPPFSCATFPLVPTEVPPASTTSIGFGSVSLRATDGSVTTIGFGAPAVPSAAVQHLGVVGRAAGRKKAVLEPIPNVSNNPAEAMQPTCVSKKARIE
eukprot:scaffold3448_cov107-Isochrysis_galbana.AAC.2